MVLICQRKGTSTGEGGHFSLNDHWIQPIVNLCVDILTHALVYSHIRTFACVHTHTQRGFFCICGIFVEYSFLVYNSSWCQTYLPPRKLSWDKYKKDSAEKIHVLYTFLYMLTLMVVIYISMLIWVLQDWTTVSYDVQKNIWHQELCMMRHPLRILDQGCHV